MRPKEVIEFVKSIVIQPKSPAIYIWGGPGVGKSDVMRYISKLVKMKFIDCRLALFDPTDLRGIPVIDGNTARWLPPSMLPTKGRGILFLDELNLAPPLVQSSAYQLVLDRKIGEYQLPDGWSIVAAGNKAEHGANIYKMAVPLRNRFIHIDFEINLNDWRAWAVKNKIASEVVEFISFRSELLFDLDTSRAENAFPTPRSWEFVSKILKDLGGLDKDIVNKAIAGAVGAGAAMEFESYLKIKETLPEIDDILEGEDYKPEDSDIACAVVTALAIRAKPKHFERLLHYSRILPSREIGVLLVKLLAVKNKEVLRECPSYKNWAVDNYDIVK